MANQRAVIINDKKQSAFVTDRAIPALRPGYLLVKVAAIALNPTDWKHVDNIATPNALSGCDYAGTVEETGTGYEKKWKKGDRICGATHGADGTQLENGSFAEHIVVKADVQMRIPASMSFEEASTLGIGIITVGQGLFQYMKLDLPTSPSKEPKPVLIYGGSTATGTLGIQFARLAGYTPITTCSPSNFDLVKSLGAAAVFNYNDTDCAEQIRKYTDNKLNYAWDTISLPESMKICAESLGASNGGETLHYGSLLQPKNFPRQDVEVYYTLAYTAFGESFFKGKEFPPVEENFTFAKMWIGLVDQLMEEGVFKVHPPKVMEGGLQGVIKGMDMMRKNQVSGVKLVYRVA